MKRFFVALLLGLTLPTCALLAQQAKVASREEAIRIAAQALKEECEAKVDCQFLPSRFETGWSVLVWFCHRGANGACEYTLNSGHKFVFVNDDGTVRVVDRS